MPPKRGPVGRGRVDGEEEPVWLQLAIEMVEHQPGLDAHGATGDVQRNHLSKVLARVEHDRVTHRLAALRRPGASGKHRDASLTTQGQGRFHVGDVPRDHDSLREDLVDGSVGGVQAAAEGIETDLPSNFTGKTLRERRSRPSMAAAGVLSGPPRMHGGHAREPLATRREAGQDA